MSGYDLMRDIIVVHFNDVNQAIAQNGQITLESTDGKSTIKISFFSKPIYCASVDTYLCAFAIESGLYDHQTFTALCRPSIKSSQYLILKINGTDYSMGDSDDYEFFSYGAVVWAHENNWEFPVGLPEHLLHPNIRAK